MRKSPSQDDHRTSLNYVNDTTHPPLDKSDVDNDENDDDDDDDIPVNLPKVNHRPRNEIVADIRTLSRQLQQQKPPPLPSPHVSIQSSLSLKPPPGHNNTARLSLTKQNHTTTATTPRISQLSSSGNRHPIIHKSTMNVHCSTNISTIYETHDQSQHPDIVHRSCPDIVGKTRSPQSFTPQRHHRQHKKHHNNDSADNDDDDDDDALPPPAFPPSATAHGTSMKKETMKADVLSKKKSLQDNTSDDDCDSDDTEHLLQYRSTRTMLPHHPSHNHQPSYAVPTKRSMETNDTTQSSHTSSVTSTTTASTSIRPKVKSFLKVSPEFTSPDRDHPNGQRSTVTTTIRQRNRHLDSCKLQLLQPSIPQRHYNDAYHAQYYNPQHMAKVEEYQKILRDREESTTTSQSSNTTTTSRRQHRPSSKK
jgi:hypothetical protein